jgi:transposase InsO family protein
MRCSERRGWSRVQSGRLAPAVAELGSFCGVLALIASGLAAGCRAYPRVVESPFAADAECLNAHVFESLEDAEETLTSWRSDYNAVRPHSALGMLTLREFAELGQRNAGR